MNKVLLVDNESTLLEKLQKLIPDSTETVSWNALKNVIADKYDLIVLSGSSSFPVESNEKELGVELNVVRTTNTPIIGICLGHEIIVKSFGGTLRKMPVREKGLVEIRVVDEHPMFNGLDSFLVYENHTYAADSLGDELTPLAVSDHGTAIVKHREKDIYGFQFHPENFTERTLGDEVFISIYNILLQ